MHTRILFCLGIQYIQEERRKLASFSSQKVLNKTKGLRKKGVRRASTKREEAELEIRNYFSSDKREEN